jgi:benzoate/toluate 1,2-dioxygenase subunit alpha
VVEPIAVDRTEAHAYPCGMLGAPDALNGKLIHYSARHVFPGGQVQVDDLEAFARVQIGLRVQALQWELFKLGSGQEHVNEHGERVNEGISEMLHRGRWHELMGDGGAHQAIGAPCRRASRRRSVSWLGARRPHRP